MQAFRYVEAQGATTENLKSAAVAKQLIVMSEVLLEAFDNNKIVPFSLLTKEKKPDHRQPHRGRSQWNDSNTMSMLTFNKAEKVKKTQDLMDGLLRSAYPFISEGRGLTSSLTPLELPYNIKVIPKYVPEGEEDFTTLILGQLGEKPLSVKIWKDGSQFCTCSHDFLKWRSQWMFLDRRK